MSTETSTQQRCPTCESPLPKLHPVVQFEGEVQPCADPWHGGETSTQQRPWTDVISVHHNDTVASARVAQYAAMAYAHLLAHELAIEDSPYWSVHEALEEPGPDDLMATYRRHGAPWTAAFAAAALFAGWSPDEVNRYLFLDGHKMVAQVKEWLTAAGINPAEIAPAS